MPGLLACRRREPEPLAEPERLKVGSGDLAVGKLGLCLLHSALVLSEGMSGGVSDWFRMLVFDTRGEMLDELATIGHACAPNSPALLGPGLELLCALERGVAGTATVSD